ncbi:LVIVD repeat-containing protein [Methanomethylovorans sp.]|uniref:LVIVD repeat-containing protein n=1 Tax=Methanomethylovorans sp. TaxID=2758717 RepID=UPI00351BFF13
MQIKLSGSIYTGMVIFFIITSGISSADVVNMEKVSFFEGNVSSLTIAENYTYIAQGHDLVVLDGTNVSNISEIGRLAVPWEIHDVVISGNYVYVTNGTDSLFSMNITDPSSPMFEGSFDPSGLVVDVEVAGNYAYVIDHHNGLIIEDISNLSSPTQVSSLNLNDLAYGIALSGKYAYVTVWNGLMIIDISDPASPIIMGNHAIPEYNNDVYVSGNYAYMICDESNTLEIVDISNPVEPSFAGIYYYAADGQAYDVAVSGNYVCLAVCGGLRILDITDPAAPTFAGSYDTNGSVSDVEVTGNYVYVTEDKDGLLILDLNTGTETTTQAANSTRNSTAGKEKLNVLCTYTFPILHLKAFLH